MPRQSYISLKITPLTTKVEKEFAIVIANTLSRLPPKIRKKIMDKVSFDLDRYGPIAWITANPNPNEPTIFLNIVEMAKRSDSYKMRTIAHEIAHFALKHPSGKGSKLLKEREREVNDLCKKWGFGRAYRNVFVNKATNFHKYINTMYL